MKHLLTISLTVAVLSLFAGCGQKRDPLSSSAPKGVSGPLARLTSGARLDSAHLLLHVRQPGGELIVVHPADQPWIESAVTWNSVGPWVSIFVINTFSAVDTGEIKVDVSTLVNGWLVGTRPNNGILLDQNPPYIEQTRFDSRESGEGCPRLRLFLSDADSTMIWTFRASGDAYVDENHPDANMGHDSALYSGYEPGMPGETRAMINFDLNAPVAYATLGDRVWHDLNANGIQDSGEPGMADVVVNLYDCSDAALASTVSGGDGSYRFDSLTAGSYRLEVVPPAGYLFSPYAAGADPFADSDVDPATGRTGCIAVADGQIALEWDAGLVLPLAVESGCTHGLAYWRKHAGFRNRPDLVAPLLPIWLGSENGAKSLKIETAKDARRAMFMFGYGHPFNGITRLYAQLLVARLNVGAGASPDAITALLAEVDAFLAENNWRDYRHLDWATRKKIWLWRSALWQYNAGKIGPGSCDDAYDDGHDGDD